MLFLVRKTSKNCRSCLPRLPGSQAGSLPSFWLTKSHSKRLLLRACSHQCKTSRAGSCVLMLKD